MDYYDIRRYAQIGHILEQAEKTKFNVSAIKIRVGADRTEEINLSELSDDFKNAISEALKKEQKHIESHLTQIIAGN